MRRLISIALAGLISSVIQAAPNLLQPEDLYLMQWATDPQIRGDGTQIVYARETNDIMSDRLVTSLWIIDTATGPSPDQEEATNFFTASARNIQRGGAEAGEPYLRINPRVCRAVGASALAGGTLGGGVWARGRARDM